MIVKYEKDVNGIFRGETRIKKIYKGILGVFGVNPFTAKTYKILKENFPTKIGEIIEYGNMHPQIVPFIENDPMLVCSLGIEGMPIRWLRSDAIAYISLGTGVSSSTGCYFKAQFYIFTWGSSYCGLAGMNGSPQIGYRNGGWTTGAVSSAIPYAPAIGGIYIYEWNKSGIGDYIIDGQDTGLRRTGTFTPNIFFCESVPKYAQMSHIWYKASSGGYEMHLVPWKENCLIDINAIGIDGKQIYYRKATSSGSFTIEYTLTDGSPWIPIG